MLIASGDRDAFQLASPNTTILYPQRGGALIRIGPAEVQARYGVEPAQVPDFIALRGDSSDNIPGAPGVGAKGAAALLKRYGSLERLVGRRAISSLPRATANVSLDCHDGREGANSALAQSKSYLGSGSCAGKTMETRSARRTSNSACGGAFSIRLGVQKIPWSKVRSERLDALTGGASGAVSRSQWPPATARLSDACLKRCLNADASAKVRKQYRTQFEGRSTYMSHSNDEPSSQSRTSMAASSKDNGTWNGKSRLISRIALTRI